MATRTRSPSYPSTTIDQAIEFARRLHSVERTNAVERDVAAKAMGYTGLSGRSATVLSDLSQYGLLDRAGKSEVRVSSLAVELIYPDDQRSFEVYLKQAATKPELFQRIVERFPDGTPSAAALEAFLIKTGFTHTAIPAAVRAFRETYSYLENAIVSESNSPALQRVPESSSDQRLDEAATMDRSMLTAPAVASPQPVAGKAPATTQSVGPDVRLVNKQIHLAGILDTQADADDLIATITALKAMLKPAVPTLAPEPSPQSTQSYAVTSEIIGHTDIKGS